MKIFIIMAALLALLVSAQAQQTAAPTAEQITIQLLEQEAANYRRTISQLAVQLNAVAKERDELKAKLPAEEKK